jgi:amidase
MSGFKDYDDYDALGLAQLVSNKDVRPDELLDEAIRRVETTDSQVNALTQHHYDLAKAAIDEGLPEGPFRGVPFLLKDLGVGLKGTITSAACKLTKDSVADHDSTLVERYKRAGLVIFGKTNTPEFGLTATTEPDLFGPSHNPWSLEHSTGGSSGGAAAAVAAGYVPVAHASDGGGSIRIPAACCGVFGMKPSRARTPSGPDIGEGWAGLSLAHCVSRTVRDSAALLDASHGAAPGDPYAAPHFGGSFLEEMGRSPGRLRIAVQTKPNSDTVVHPDCLAAVAKTAKLLEDMGHIVEEAEPDLAPGAIGDALRFASSVGTAANLDAHAERLGRPITEEDVEWVTWRTYQRAKDVLASDYARSIQLIHQVTRKCGFFFEDYDLHLAPTLGTPPRRLGELDTMNKDTKPYATLIGSYSPFTAMFNITGQPSTSIPMHWNDEGLPIGVMLTGRFGDEATLFQASRQLEEANPWAARRPPTWSGV